MISPIVKHKNLIKIVKSAIMDYCLHSNPYTEDSVRFPLSDNFSYFNGSDLRPSNYQGPISILYRDAYSPVECNGISVSNIGFSTSFVINNSTLIIRRVNKKLVFGIDISNDKILTNNEFLYSLASYCVVDYVLPKYYRSENFVKALNDIDKYLTDNTNINNTRPDIFTTTVKSYSDFQDMKKIMENFINKSSTYSSVSSCFDIDTGLLNQLFSMIDKAIGIGSSNSINTLLNNITDLVYENEDSYRYNLYHFKIIGFLSKVHATVLDCFNSALPKYKLCLSDLVRGMTKSHKMYINDNILPVAYIEDVSGLSGHVGKETKLSILRVRKNGDFSISNVFIRNDNIGNNKNILISSRGNDIYNWIKRNLSKSHSYTGFGVFKIKE